MRSRNAASKDAESPSNLVLLVLLGGGGGVYGMVWLKAI